MEKQTGTQVKWKKFVDEYMTNGFDRTAAAVAAGYEKDSASSCAAYLLTRPEIQRLIRKHQNNAAQKYAITQDMLMEQYEDAYLKAREENNIAGMIAATTCMGKLAGLVVEESKAKMDLNVKSDSTVTVKQPEIEARIARLKAAIGETHEFLA